MREFVTAVVLIYTILCGGCANNAIDYESDELDRTEHNVAIDDELNVSRAVPGDYEPFFREHADGFNELRALLEESQVYASYFINEKNECTVISPDLKDDDTASEKNEHIFALMKSIGLDRAEYVSSEAAMGIKPTIFMGFSDDSIVEFTYAEYDFIKESEHLSGVSYDLGDNWFVSMYAGT